MIKTINSFIKWESSGGIILVMTAVLALIVSNSALAPVYEHILSAPFTISFGDIGLSKPFILWVNDGLMAIFFLLVGLEIKREVIEGELNSISKIMLPGFAAVGGMLCPALIYISFNHGDALALRGWAIPAATDIAFALGLLSILGSRIPSSLKVFLTAIAILDDLGAIVIIAVFYTAHLSLTSLGLGVGALLALFVLNRMGVNKFFPYALVGVVLWVCVLKSGVHATLAGVAIAMAYPLRAHDDPQRSPLRDLEQALHPWVAFGVLPIFAFVNAGMRFTGFTFSTLFEPIPLGIAAGLFIGKQIGVFGTTWVCIQSGLAKMPAGASWASLYGIAILCGIGFTMSLFIGSLAFIGAGEAHGALLRLGVLSGSVLSGIAGYLLLRFTSNSSPAE